jgi:hypothetical protein
MRKDSIQNKILFLPETYKRKKYEATPEKRSPFYYRSYRNEDYT